MKNIDSKKRITCIIDDSHGIGVIGDNGKGISSFLPLLNNVDYIITYSLSKAFHINGGAVSCNTKVADQLMNSPLYTGSTAISPALIYAFLNSSKLYHKQLQALTKNIADFIELLKNKSLITYNPQLPIFILPESMDEAFFEKHNIIVSSFSYPNPTGYKINRIVLNSLHTKGDLEKVSSLINSY